MMNDAVLAEIPSPCFVLDQVRLERNLRVFEQVQNAAPVRILLALKAFALFHSFPMMQRSLAGASASSLWEARLASEQFGGSLHVYSPAYRDQDLPELMDRATHLTFNSLSQWERSRDRITKAAIGLRINPLYSPVKTALYNPCQSGSRLGVVPEQLDAAFGAGGRVCLPDAISGFLCHNLCESDSFALEKTLQQIEQYYGHLLPQIRWLNLGGGHLMTHQNYDLDHAIAVLCQFHDRHPHLELILEPGSAIVWQTGFLLSTVLDLIPTAAHTHVMLDVSFAAHLPDCLEMPYQPEIVGASISQGGYRLGGASCLAGDFMGDYQFDRALSIGDRILFEDMMHYTMVKTTMFNGVAHPAIGCLKRDGSFELWRKFGYEDYQSRVG